ncbi:hypothetical protein [Hymenobacter guriensis]|uniref:Uncharacterized protein n=1 Tax=Hymenobacter guriensis TaxID=2793065 RepID=A0ABS0L4L4_9BACT|nr:hypothetical protein [Hymenobacter guriensis]MBG8555098.1 hypothetical protein [Hymenobacter guriensis]
MKKKFTSILHSVRQKGKKVAVVGALSAGMMVAVAPANKAEAKWFGTAVECDGFGGARSVTRIFGIAVSEGGTVPNSAMCQ